MLQKNTQIPNYLMFTGIITTTGTISHINKKPQGSGLTLGCQYDCPHSFKNCTLKPGSSIAVNGACLTLTRIERDTIFFDVSHETLAKTNLQYLQSEQYVNLEPAVQLGDSLDGHLVSGHVDATAEVTTRQEAGDSLSFIITPPRELLRFIAVKGSVCLDGVSLTVNQLYQDSFVVDIVPFTQQQTIIQNYQPGYKVNVEVDLIARYLERLLQSGK